VTLAVAADPVTAVAARVRGVRKVFGSTVAVDDVDLDIPDGAVLGMLGPNGSGKTTLIRMLLGLTRPTTGTVELLGRAMPEAVATVLPHVGALVEGPGFHPFLSGRENLRRVAATEPLLATRAIPAAVDAALDRVGLGQAADRRFRGYSLGMKQRLGLAGALLLPRRLVVLDEPTNGLDPEGVRWLRGYVRRLADEGRTVLVSSHALSEVEQTADDVLVIARGRLVRSSSLAALRAEAGVGSMVRTPDPDRLGAALDVAGHSYRQERGGLAVDAAPELVGELAAAHGVVLHALAGTGGLEHAFFRLVGEPEPPEETVASEEVLR